ncbi:MAG: TetR/AcrR family transcriptional regulator, partial [Hyphomicrobiales bacterium]
LLGPGVRSMEWMMAAAEVETPGLRGLARANGLLFVFLSAYRTWLEDDDPGLAPTMATLDRQLRRGENMLKNADMPIGLGRALFQVACNLRKNRKQATDPGDAEATPST